MCAMEGREDDVRGMECELGCADACLHRPSTYTFPHPAVRVHRSLAKHSVLNQTSFRSTEHTAPSASSQYGDALATTPPLVLTTQRAVQNRGSLPLQGVLAMTR